MKISVGDKLLIYRRGYHAMRAIDREEATVVDMCLSISSQVFPPKVEVSLKTNAGAIVKTDMRQLMEWLEHACIFQHEAEAIYRIQP